MTVPTQSAKRGIRLVKSNIVVLFYMNCQCIFRKILKKRKPRHRNLLFFISNLRVQLSC